MKNYNESIKNILDFSFSTESNSLSKSRDFAKKYDSDYIHIFNSKKNEMLIEQNALIDDIFILIHGITYIVQYTSDGRRIIADTLSSGQIFCLMEVINGEKYSKGSVITLSNCLFAKVNSKMFLEIMYEDIKIASHVIKYLSSFSTKLMTVAEYKTSVSAYDNLILYLYNRVIGKSLPIKIEDSKTFIADSLHINKRTLYRYLNKLTDEGLISRNRQDIIISENHFSKIEDKLNSLR